MEDNEGLRLAAVKYERQMKAAREWFVTSAERLRDDVWLYLYLPLATAQFNRFGSVL